MPITVREFRSLITRHSDRLAIGHMRALKKRTLGFSFRESFTQKPGIIHSIVAEAVLDANEPLLESSMVRSPEWMSSDTLNLLISKMSIYASNNL